MMSEFARQQHGQQAGQYEQIYRTSPSAAAASQPPASRGMPSTQTSTQAAGSVGAPTQAVASGGARAATGETPVTDTSWREEQPQPFLPHLRGYPPSGNNTGNTISGSTQQYVEPGHNQQYAEPVHDQQHQAWLQQQAWQQQAWQQQQYHHQQQQAWQHPP